jgi:8-hydroxy-5-deazaflavin:NADPH oxidoreductase
MRIAIIGAGNVGGTLGTRLMAKGHDVVFGVRHGGSVKSNAPRGARLTSLTEAPNGADAVILATPWAAVSDALEALGALEGVVVVDATNPIAAGLTVDAGPKGESGAERVQLLVPRARVVKAFNTTGFNNMANPVYAGAPTTMFYAGDDPSAKAIVRRLVEDVGFEPVDAGPLSRARELEHLAILWISLAQGGLGREIAFRLLHR